MSPTVLECTIAIILVLVAWQIGVLIAPTILREIRSMKQSLDDVDDQFPDDEEK
jgi:hypothetical protein